MNRVFKTHTDNDETFIISSFNKFVLITMINLVYIAKLVMA